jgi:peptidoglycan/xylan/chitin deacetylase (PgdA/CDA1 family)
MRDTRQMEARMGLGDARRAVVPSRRALLAALGLAGGGVLAGCGAAASKSVARRTAPLATPVPKPVHSTPVPTTASPLRSPARTDTPGPPAVEIVHGPRDRKQVALTFHGNGDPALAEALLREAEQRKALITVFAVGNWLQAHEPLGRRILAAGHELANHTYTHPDLGALAQPAVEDEFARARDVLIQVSGSNGTYARPSAMDRSTPLVRAAAGLVGYRTVVAFDVDPADYTDPGAAAVISRTLAGVRPGRIVSMHLGHAGTVQGLPAILDGLATRGLRPVTVHTLLD